MFEKPRGADGPGDIELASVLTKTTLLSEACSPAAGDIEMAKVLTKTTLLSKGRVGRGRRGRCPRRQLDPCAAGADASADGGPAWLRPAEPLPLSISRRPSRPRILSGGASSPPPDGLPQWAIWVFFGMCVFFLVIWGMLYSSRVCHLAIHHDNPVCEVIRKGRFKLGLAWKPGLDPSRLTGTWRNLQGQEYVIESTEEGMKVGQKVMFGYKSVGDLDFPDRAVDHRFFSVFWLLRDHDIYIEGGNEAGKDKISSMVAFFDLDKAKNEVTYISWNINGKVARYDVWIRVEKTKAAQEEMRTVLDGTWYAMVADEWTEAKVVRKDGKQVWLQEGAQESPIGLSSDGKLFERQADGMRLTWDGYVKASDPRGQVQTMVWKNPGEDPSSHPPQWQKAFQVPIDSENMKGKWFVRPLAGGPWTELTEDHCYGEVSRAWFGSSATWKHANLAWKADTVETLLGDTLLGNTRRIKWTSEGQGAMLWQDKVPDARTDN